MDELEELKQHVAEAERKLEEANQKMAAATAQAALALKEAKKEQEAFDVADAAFVSAQEANRPQYELGRLNERATSAYHLRDLAFHFSRNANGSVSEALALVHLRRDELAAFSNALHMNLTNWGTSRFDQFLSKSPLNRTMHSHAMKSIRAANSDAVCLWDFEAPKEKTQKDRVKKLRESTARHYGVWKNSGDCMCQLSRQWGDYRHVATSHLLKHSTKEHLKDAIEIDDINNPRNLLLLAKNIDTAFERGQVYFIQPDGPNNEKKFQMRIWDDSVKTEAVFDGSSVTIGDCEYKFLMIPVSREPPYKRVLSDHAQASYNHALENGWIQPTEQAPVEYGSPLANNILSFRHDSSTVATAQSAGHTAEEGDEEAEAS